MRGEDVTEDERGAGRVGKVREGEKMKRRIKHEE